MDIREFRWCPKCGNGGIATCGDAICEQCKFHFCVECMLEKHELSCAEHMSRMLAGERGKRKEARQLQEVQESVKWIGGNTKPCPNCHCSIKKSGGCSHMTCRACKYEFCCEFFAPSIRFHSQQQQQTGLCMGKYKGVYTMDERDPCNPQPPAPATTEQPTPAPAPAQAPVPQLQ